MTNPGLESICYVTHSIQRNPMSQFFLTAKACEDDVLPSTDLASERLGTLLIICHQHLQRLS